MVPHAAPLQPAPLTLQVTAKFEVPVTVAANCCVIPTAAVALFGLTFITTAPAEFVGLVELLFGLVRAAHPARNSPPVRTRSIRNLKF